MFSIMPHRDRTAGYADCADRSNSGMDQCRTQIDGLLIAPRALARSKKAAGP
jgi:hypothetical protein